MNKLSKEQSERFDERFTTGVGGVLVSKANALDHVVVADEVKQHLADEVARAREENNETMTDREEILLLRIDSKLSHLLRLQRLAFDPVNNDLFRLKKGEEKRYIRE